MESVDSIQGSQPLSRYGDSFANESYPRYYPRRTCKRAPVGLHRFEPVEWNGITSAPGNSITRQGISLRLVTTIHIEGLVISANLYMSPCSSDSIFTHLHHECLAYSL